MTSDEIASFFANPHQPLHRRFEAMRLFFHEGCTARDVADRLGYSLSAVYNMTRDFRKLDDPAAAFFRDPVPRGRPPVRPGQGLRERIVELRKRNLSVPDIKAWLDAEGEHSSSERMIDKVLKDEGLRRLPRPWRSGRGNSPPGTLSAASSRGRPCGLSALGYRIRTNLTRTKTLQDNHAKKRAVSLA